MTSGGKIDGRLARLVGAAGGDGSGARAGAVDGAPLIVLQFQMVRSGDLQEALAFTLVEARRLQFYLDEAIRDQSRKVAADAGGVHG